VLRSGCRPLSATTWYRIVSYRIGSFWFALLWFGSICSGLAGWVRSNRYIRRPHTLSFVSDTHTEREREGRKGARKVNHFAAGLT